MFRSRRDSTSRGQAMVEFAMVLPLLVLLLVMAIDFGRLFFGWVGLHNAARIGADYAAQYPDADWADPDDPQVQAYVNRINADSAAINCALSVSADQVDDTPAPAWRPSFPEGTDVGDDALVALECDFDLLTPIMSGLMGSPIQLAADATFPIRKGFAEVPVGGGGGGPSATPCALVPDMVGGTVAEARTAWFNRGFRGFFAPPSGFDDDSVTAQTTNPSSIPESDCIPLDSTVSVSSVNAVGCPSGEARIPLLTGQTVGEARDAWSASVFTGSFSPSGQNNFWAATQDPAAGECRPLSASMTIGVGPAPTPRQCVAPSFVGRSTAEAPGLWSGAAFTGTIIYKGPTPFIVGRQSLVAGQTYDCTADVSLWK